MNRTDKAFLSRYTQWLQTHLPIKSKSRIAPVLRRAIYDELRGRDNETQISEYVFKTAAALRLSISSRTVCVRGSGRMRRLTIAIAAPGWRQGWKQLTKDEYLGLQVSWFFHFASQYIMRSYLVSALGAVALVYKEGIEVNRGVRYHEERLSLATASINLPEFLNRKKRWKPIRSSHSISAKQARVHSWMRSINGLDPYVHRAVFLYIRAISLLEQGFEEQGVTCLDSVSAVASEYVRNVLRIHDVNPREAMYRALDMTSDQAQSLRQLYELRCYFGGHPSPTKWWDFRELYEDEIERSVVTCQLVLKKLCESERRNRRIDPEPRSWHDWFLAHAGMLWNAVGFDRLPV